MEQSNPPLRASNISDIKAQVETMIAEKGGGAPSTPGGYAYVLYTGDSSTNSITLSDSAFKYDKLVVEGYYMAMGSAAMNIAVTTEWSVNKNYRKFQFTTSDLTTGSTPALTTTTDVWEISEDGHDLDLILALQGVDTDNIEVTPESTSQITITKVTGFNNLTTGPQNVGPYTIPYFEGGEYGAVAYLDRNGEIAYYTAVAGTATNGTDLLLSRTVSGVVKTLPDGYQITSQNILAYSFGSIKKSIPANFLNYSTILQVVYGWENVTGTIGNTCLGHCPNFNSPINIPSTVTSIGNNFLDSGAAFNSPITFTESTTTIGSFFLASCTAFNTPLALPTSLTSLGAGFLWQCSTFNQPINIPATTVINSDANGGFLQGCQRFNQPITVPVATTAVPINFLSGCSAFNSPITFAGSPTSIGRNFLYNCYSFNRTLTFPSSIINIDTYFMADCTGFSQSLTLPENAAINIAYFMNNTQNFLGPLDVKNTTFSGTSNIMYALGQTSNTAPAYVEGATLTGANAEDWKTAMPDRTTSPYRKLLLAEGKSSTEIHQVL